MFTSKAEFSQTAQAIHTVIQATSQPVKLGSIREAIAHALKYKTANGLLSDLPVEIPSFFYDSLSQQLLEQHRIKWHKPSYEFPWHQGIQFSEEEINSIWLSACASNDYFGDANKNISGIDALKGVRPNGRGGWFYSGTPPLCYKMVFTDTQIDPKTLFPESLINSEIVAEITANIAPLCIDYWNEHQSFFILQTFSTLATAPLKDNDNNPIDLSELLELTAKDIFSTQRNIYIDDINPFAHTISPFVVTSFDMSKNYDVHPDQIPYELVVSILEDCLLYEMMGFDYKNLFWKPLEQVCPCPKESRHEKRDFYLPFIYSKELVQSIEKIALSWIKKQPDWEKTLREIIAPKWGFPVQNHTSLLVMFNPFAETQITQYKLPNDRTISTLNRSYCYGDNPFQEDYEQECEFEFVFEFDSESYKKELLSDDDMINESSEDGKIPPALIERFVQEAEAKARAEAAKEYDEAKYNAPFVEPFIIESLTVKQTYLDARELEVVGDLFVDLSNISTIGHHGTLLDEMSENFSTLASFIQVNHEFFLEFGDEDVFKSLLYITDFILTTETSYDDMATVVANYFNQFGDISNSFVLFHPKAFKRRYPSSPYSTINELSDEYNKAKSDLVESFTNKGLACLYI